MAAGGLFVVALLIAVTLYVSNLKAADKLRPQAETVPPQKVSATPTGTEQIKQLQARIDSLEKRLATLESSRTNIWDIVPINPPINPQQPPGLKFIPAPPPNESERDGFPKARIIFIDGKRSAAIGDAH
jgi:hypothetical protein